MPANRFPIFEEVPCVLASLVPDGLTEELLPMGLDISLAVPDFQKSEIGKLLPDAWYGSSEPCRTGYIYIPVGCARVLTDSVEWKALETATPTTLEALEEKCPFACMSVSTCDKGMCG